MKETRPQTVVTAAANEPATEAVERLVEELEEDIVFGRRHPRERLVEWNIAERSGVNRHVVRQALAALEGMGLIERKRNKGAVVRAFTAVDAEQIFSVRTLLESEAAATIALPANEAVLAALTDVQRRHDSGCATGDLRAVFRANIKFHGTLFQACGNPYLFEAIDAFANRSHAIRSFAMIDPAYREAARQDHWAMIEALRTGDRDQLVALCRGHTERSKNGYIQAYNRRFAWQDPVGPNSDSTRKGSTWRID